MSVFKDSLETKDKEQLHNLCWALDIDFEPRMEAEDLRNLILQELTEDRAVENHSIADICIAMAIADDHLADREMDEIRRLASTGLDRVGLDAIGRLEESVELIRSQSVDIEFVASELKKELSATELESLMDALFDIAIADGVFQPQEEEFLRKMQKHLQIDDRVFERQIAVCRKLSGQIPVFETEGLASHSEISEIESDQHWSESALEWAAQSVQALNPPSLVQNSITTLGVDTIQDLLHLDETRVRNTRGIGAKKVAKIIALKKRAKDHVRALSLDTDELSDDDSVSDWWETLKKSVGHSLVDTVRSRLDGQTLQAIAVRENVSREAIRQRQIRGVSNLRSQGREVGFPKWAKELANKLLASSYQPIEHLIQFLPESVSPDELKLLVTIAGFDHVEERGDFLFALSEPDATDPLINLKSSLQQMGRSRIHERDVVDVAASVDLAMDAEVLGCLLAQEWGLRSHDGWYFLPWASLKERFGDLVHEFGRPCKIDEVKARIRSIHDIQSKEFSESQLIKQLYDCDEVLAYGPRHFVHIENIPINEQDFNEAVEFGKGHLKTVAEAVDCRKIIEIFEEQFEEIPGVTPYLLASALSRHGGVIPLDGSVVAWRTTFLTGNNRVESAVEQVLSAADEPLSIDEVLEELDDQSLSGEDILSIRSVVPTGDGRLVHISSLGLSSDAVEQILDRAFETLSPGEQRTAISLVSSISDTPIREVFEPSTVLWSLASKDKRFAVGRGEMIALATADSQLNEQTLMEVIENWGVIFFGELCTAVNDEGLSWDRDDIRTRLDALVSGGKVTKLVGGAFHITKETDEALFELWSNRPDVIYQAARRSDFEKNGAKVASKVANFLCESLGTTSCAERVLKMEGLDEATRASLSALVEPKTEAAPADDEIKSRSVDALYRLLRQ